MRETEIERFGSDASVTVFLVSIKAGSVGLNLACASQVIILDPSWNPATEKQAIDRVHRIGQVRPVEVNRIIIPETVEGRILALQERVSGSCGLVDIRNKGKATRRWERVHRTSSKVYQRQPCCLY